MLTKSQLPIPEQVERLDPRVRRTRSGLVQAFLSAVTEKGFQAVSVQDIAERAGVNRTTFYLHFPDKYALLDYSIAQAFGEEISQRGLQVCHFSPDTLRALLLLVCEFTAEIGSRCGRPDPQLETLVEPQIRSHIQSILEHWLVAGDTDPGQVATAASWAIYGLAQRWGRAKPRPDIGAYVEQVLPLISGILAVPAGNSLAAAT